VNHLLSAIASSGGDNPIEVTDIYHGESTANATVYTYNTTGSSGYADKFAVVGVSSHSSDGAMPVSVTIGGVTATKVAGLAGNSSVDGTSTLWACNLGASPTDDIVVTFAGGQVSCAVTLLSATNINETVYDNDYITATAATVTTTVATVAGGVTFAQCHAKNYVVSGVVEGDAGTFIVHHQHIVDGLAHFHLCASRVGDEIAVADTITFTPNDAGQRLTMAVASFEHI